MERDINFIKRERVFKYGFKTKFTEGKVDLDNEQISYTIVRNKHGFFEHSLYYQVKIKPAGAKCIVDQKTGKVHCIEEPVPFGVQGDSGAPIFISKGGELILVGVLVAVNNNGDAFMTPINAVLDELDLQNLEHFKLFPDDEQSSPTVQTDSEAMTACKVNSSNALSFEDGLCDVNANNVDAADAEPDDDKNGNEPIEQNQDRDFCKIINDKRILQNGLANLTKIEEKIGDGESQIDTCTQDESTDLPSSNSKTNMLSPAENTTDVDCTELETDSKHSLLHIIPYVSIICNQYEDETSENEENHISDEGDDDNTHMKGFTDLSISSEFSTNVSSLEVIERLLDEPSNMSDDEKSCRPKGPTTDETLQQNEIEPLVENREYSETNTISNNAFVSIRCDVDINANPMGKSNELKIVTDDSGKCQRLQECAKIVSNVARKVGNTQGKCQGKLFNNTKKEETELTKDTQPVHFDKAREQIVFDFSKRNELEEKKIFIKRCTIL